jgi:serine-type D-Ala-D-Ala carboxypeptidase (penicillin-binding protein 5/6)
MRGSTRTRGRLVPLLLFIVVLAVLGWALAGPALGAASAPAPSAPQTESFEFDPSGLGLTGGDPPGIKAQSAIVEDMETGKVIYEHNAGAQRAMASTTKIMTAMIILESGMGMDDKVTVSANAAKTYEPTTWLRTGDVLTVEQLMYALLVHSANSAAVALAEANAGSVGAFADKMNEKAAKLGMKNTHFVTPNGLDASEHHSTATDMALLTRYAMKNATFRRLVSTKSYSLAMDRRAQPLSFSNTNSLLRQYDWVTGVKTGYTDDAGYCLVVTGTKNGRSAVAVVLGETSSDRRFSDGKALLDYGLTHYRSVTLVDKGVALAEASVPYQTEGELQLVTDAALDVDLDSSDIVTTKVSVEKPLQFPVVAGDVYGHVVAAAGGEEIGRVNLVATKSFGAPSLGSKLAYYFHRLGAALGVA